MRSRSSGMMNTLFAILMGLSVLGLTHVTRAEDDAQVQAARARFQEGVKHYDAKQYAKARVAFTQAYALKPHPAVLLNLAQSELRSDHEADAANHFSRYLREVDANAPTRKEAERGLAQAKQKAGEVIVKVTADGAQVSVDDQVQGSSPLEGPVYVAPGSHTFEAKLGSATAIVSVEAAAGQSQTAKLSIAAGKEMQTSPDETPTPKRKQSRKAAEEEEDSAEGGPGRPDFFSWVFGEPAGLVLGGLTVVGLGSGVAFLVLANNANNSAKAIETNIMGAYPVAYPDRYAQSIAPCNPPPDQAFWNECKRYVDTTDKKKMYNTVGYAGLGVGAAAAVATIAVYFLTTSSGESKEESPPPRKARKSALQLIPVALPSLQGLTVSGRF